MCSTENGQILALQAGSTLGNHPAGVGYAERKGRMKGEEVLAKMRGYGVVATLRTLQRYEAAGLLPPARRGWGIPASAGLPNIVRRRSRSFMHRIRWCISISGKFGLKTYRWCAKLRCGWKRVSGRGMSCRILSPGITIKWRRSGIGWSTRPGWRTINRRTPALA